MTDNATITVQGRGHPVVSSVTSDAHGVTIRLDDRTRADLWAEVSITAAMLHDLQAAVAARQAEERADSGQSDDCISYEWAPDDVVGLTTTALDLDTE